MPELSATPTATAFPQAVSSETQAPDAPGAAVPACVWLSVADAAALLGVSARTVRRRIERGEMASKSVALESGGRAWFVSLGDKNQRPNLERAAKRTDSVRTANGQRADKRTDSATKRSNKREIERTDSERTQRADSVRTGTTTPTASGFTEREPTRREIEQQEEIRFLRGTIEQLQRDGAETRAALRAALKLAAPESVPQLTAKPETAAPQTAGDGDGSKAGTPQPERARPLASNGGGGDKAGAALTYGDIADALEADLKARGVNLG